LAGKSCIPVARQLGRNVLTLFVAQQLATEIDAVRTSRHFYGYHEGNVLALEFDGIRQGITEYLLPAHPRAAAELLGRLIRLD
jgi:hypothetical protein